MAEYSKLASGSLLAQGTTSSAAGAQVVVIPFLPDYIEITNTTEISAATGGVTRAWWLKDMGQGAAAYVTTSTGPADGTNYTTSNGFTTIQAALALQYGPTVLLGTTGGAGIAKTGSTSLTVTTAAAHGLVPGNWVVFQNLYQSSTTGMQQIAGIPFEVLTVATSTTFTIGWVGNSSNLTAITTAATGAASFKQILYPVLYAPGVAVPWSISQTNGVVTVKTTAAHNFVAGQEIGFRIPSVYGGKELNELPNTSIPASPQYFFVSSVLSPTSFTFNYSGTLSTFTVNATFASFPGLKFPEVHAVGDVNTGGYPYTGGALYPSPSVVNGTATISVNTINGPAIQGAYINATYQGFIIGSTIAGTTGDQIYWRAYAHDMNT